MRDDFFEVVIERPRTRPWKKRRSPYHSLPEQERPRCESMSKNRGGGKYFTDLLGPLERFLQCRIGRPWDEVYSEIREHISPGHFLQRHILEHLEHFVQTPDRPRYWGRAKFTVDPETGRLERTKRRR